MRLPEPGENSLKYIVLFLRRLAGRIPPFISYPLADSRKIAIFIFAVLIKTTSGNNSYPFFARLVCRLGDNM
ncbi:MAG: hypothetical protein A3A08_01270 [Candidatus Nealsonbacteria bacterium RIFCSPLOWO2_01_FULL_41_9]|uniref:Uncharacterized protein n=1 Tax=Candidatus Nealsonbacteria bacterium RIFCSPLOWO2_01_FULL_41_9 TaxID=1801671 RepID=A0A1G2ED18_9BACT|nr:MAG: hypothetical protein A3A08_01270 [Candidatus Nealsonbacteria bacterium RIFCSPLOWO2_01_FULL_41_9]